MKRDMKSGKFTKLQRKLMGGAPKPANEPFSFGGGLAASESESEGGGSNPASEGGKGFKTNTRSLTRDRAGFRQGQSNDAEKRRDDAAARRKQYCTLSAGNQQTLVLRARDERTRFGSDQGARGLQRVSTTLEPGTDTVS